MQDERDKSPGGSGTGGSNVEGVGRGGGGAGTAQGDVGQGVTRPVGGGDQPFAGPSGGPGITGGGTGTSGAGPGPDSPQGFRGKHGIGTGEQMDTGNPVIPSKEK